MFYARNCPLCRSRIILKHIFVILWQTSDRGGWTNELMNGHQTHRLVGQNSDVDMQLLQFFKTNKSKVNSMFTNNISRTRQWYNKVYTGGRRFFAVSKLADFTLARFLECFNSLQIHGSPQHAQMDLNKKSEPKQKTIKTLKYNPQGFKITIN